MLRITLALLAVIAFSSLTTPLASAADGASLFNSKCSMCHGLSQKKMGPAITNMTVDTKTLRAIISNGRKMMPPYASMLDAGQIDALVAYIKAQQ